MCIGFDSLEVKVMPYYLYSLVDICLSSIVKQEYVDVDLLNADVRKHLLGKRKDPNYFVKSPEKYYSVYEFRNILSNRLKVVPLIGIGTKRLITFIFKNMHIVKDMDYVDIASLVFNIYLHSEQNKCSGIERECQKFLNLEFSKKFLGVLKGLNEDQKNILRPRILQEYFECPDCNNTESIISYKRGVKVHMCTKCKSLWATQNFFTKTFY